MNAPANVKSSPAGGGSFDWQDPFHLRDQLKEDEQLIQDTARAFAQEKLLPRVIEAYREEKTDRGIFNEMGELGLLGVTLPEDYAAPVHPMSLTASLPARSSVSTAAIAP